MSRICAPAQSNPWGAVHDKIGAAALIVVRHFCDQIADASGKRQPFRIDASHSVILSAQLAVALWPGSGEGAVLTGKLPVLAFKFPVLSIKIPCSVQ
jgi:hypothetical protein